MPDITPFHLTFQSGFHVGTSGVNMEESGVTLASDTLFSALTDACERLGYGAQAWAEPFLGEPPLLFTSAFPFAGQVRFFPLPVDLRRIFTQESLEEGEKTLKSIKFFSQGLLEKALAGGDPLDAYLPDEKKQGESPKGVFLQGSALWLTAEETERLPQGFQYMKAIKGWRKRPLPALHHMTVWSELSAPRVTVFRINSGSLVYHTGKVVFAEDCGLWFGVNWRKPDLLLDSEKNHSFRDGFLNSLAALQSDGLGGERTVGYGAFTFQEHDSFPLGSNSSNELIYLLSRYHPRQDELPQALSAAGSAYKLVPIGGWLNTLHGEAQRRKRLFLVGEGSLVKADAIPAGDIADLRPEYDSGPAFPHPVYRYGLALGAAWPV